MATMSDDFDEEDGPAFFRRKNTSSNGQNHKLSSDVRSSNGQNPSAHKGNLESSTKGLPTKSPVAIPKPSTSNAKTAPLSLPVKSLSSSTKTSPLRSTVKPSNSKPPSGRSMPGAVKEENKENYDSEDSEDNKPLSVRLKGNSNHVNKGVSTPTPDGSDDEVPLSFRKKSIKKDSEVSDDEVLLSSKLSFNCSAGTSGSKYDDSDDKKPLASKIQKDGSSKSGKQERPSTLPLKRPLEKVNSSNQSSVKKTKTTDSSILMKTEQVALKAEPKLEDDDDNVPISQRLKKSAASENKSVPVKKKITKATPTRKVGSGSFKKQIIKSKKAGNDSEYSKSTKLSPSSGDGQKKWTTLVHNGVIFPPPYQPHGVNMLYKGKPVDLTPEQEEVATMFAVMKDTDYMEKTMFKENFWNDWRKLLGRNHVIQGLEDCNFTPIYDWYQKEKEHKKQMSTEEKKALKEEKAKQEDKYMWAIVDGVKEKVGNFRVEPPGLFRGRGEHPKMGKLKRRIRPSEITINIGKDAPVPECPIPGESWKEIRNDNTVTWLAFWNDPINPKLFKYVFLAASSSLKGQSDKEKYEKARMLKDYIENIRAAYTKDFTSKDITKQQIAVATYLIDKLALRAGNEKDDDEADTVGCCTLKVENVKPVAPNTLEFSFLGKDSIKYENAVEVELPVYNAILKFQKGKRPGVDLFDKLDTSKLNAHLKELMPGLTAKVFRTYNASITLDEMLNRETKGGDVADKIVVYQIANKQVAIICNHQRTVSKSHSAQMSRLTEKIDDLEGVLKELKTDLDRAKKGKPPSKSADGKKKKILTPEALEKKIAQTNAKIEKMQRDMKTKEDLKTVALGTSKINYLDPRITVAWCKRHEVPIEKIFNKSLLAKFAWAMDVDPDFRF
ncbi:DNA topoisomerase 1-like [Quillaja saponaria]|uniref:DNA topoisomerase I n=1 Tax=Quillaja saponaria TaxID=32244 RepID=A0AAD7L1I9_QUISA|nr:DNA topoisomerase 1-like [Quillaja saponaria]